AAVADGTRTAEPYPSRTRVRELIDPRAGVEPGKARSLELDRRSVPMDQLQHPHVEPLVHLHLDRLSLDREHQLGGHPPTVSALAVEPVHTCGRDAADAALRPVGGGVDGLHPGQRPSRRAYAAADDVAAYQPACERTAEVPS